jgi:hypothetical protein
MVTKPYFDSIIKILFYQYKNEKKRTANTKIFTSSYKQASRGKKKTPSLKQNHLYITGKEYFKSSQ